MVTTANPMIEYARLWRSRPETGASADVVAAWYDRKAAMQLRIAHQCTGVEKVHEQEFAVIATRHALSLRHTPVSAIGGALLVAGVS